MQPQPTLTAETLAALLASPGTRAALDAAEAGRTAERGELLRELAEQELAAAVQSDELSARVAALRAAYLPLAAKADEARQALRGAEAEGFAIGLSTEARVNALRAKLLPLGAGAIDVVRGALALERRIAENALAWRTVNEPGMYGLTSRTEPSPNNAGAHALVAAIAGALLELDALELDGGKGPGAIDARLAEIRADIEATRAGAPTPRRGQFVNPRADVESRRQVSTMAERVQR